MSDLTQPKEVQDFVDRLRAMMRHEDNVRDQRMGWFGTLQGLLWAAVAFIFQDDNGTSADNPSKERSRDLMILVGSIGLLHSTSALIASCANVHAQTLVWKTYNNAKKENPNAQHEFLKSPSVALMEDPCPYGIGWIVMPSIAVPIGFIVAWCFLLKMEAD